MIIKRIIVSNYLALAEADITLVPGLNVILAPNEGGKSSLMQAVVTGLFRSATSKSASVLATRRWGSEALPRVELRIRTGGEDLRIVRDFNDRKQRIFRDGASDHFAAGRDVDRYLGEVLVVPEEKLFVRVCGVGQEELVRVADGTVELGERLEEILGGGWGEESPARVGRALEEVRGDLRRGLDRPANRENWGPLKRYTEEVSALEDELGTAVTVENRRADLLKRLSEARHEREAMGLDILLERRERAAEYANLRLKGAELEKRLREIQERRERIEGLRGERDRITARGDAFPESLRRCDDAGYDSFRRDIEREDILMRDVEEGAGRPRGRPRATLLIAAALLVVGGLIGWALWTPVFAGVAAVGVALIAGTLARGRTEEPSAAQREELGNLVRRRSEWAENRSLDESRELLGEFDAWRRERDETEARLREALRGNDAAPVLDAARAEFVRLSAEWHALGEELKRLEPFHLEPGDLLRLEEETERAERKAGELDGTIAAVERELMGLPEPETNLLRERLASARESLERTERKTALVDLLHETLQEARGRVAGLLAEKLPPAAGRYLSVVTGGRYATVHVDPVRLHVHTTPAVDAFTGREAADLVPERVEPEKLSRGTRDQVYFAVRLAIVELLGGREPQPLILDDPFVHFDAERRGRALELVVEFSERHQVLLMSCDPEYERLGGNVIRLG